MLKDINNRRPDRQLERNLIFLAYAIMFMSLSLFAFFLYPQYALYILICVAAWNVLCILITIRILKVSEHAIGFGVMAAEILNDKTKYCRVDNSKGEAIIANRLAREYFKDMPVLEFFRKNIIDSNANKLDLQKLESAAGKLQEATVNLSINPHQNSVFVAEEWFSVSVKPIYLDKTDIFEGEYSLKKIHKESYLLWTIENITSYKNMEQVFAGEMSSLHNFLDFLPVGLYTCDSKGKIEYINNSLADWWQTDKNAAIGKSVDDFVAYKPELLHAANGVFNDNLMFKTAKGSAMAFVKQQNVRENLELKTRGVVIWDIPNDTALKDKLNLLTDKFEGLFDTAPIGIIFADKHLQILEINQYISRLFEQPADEILLRKLNVYFNDSTRAKLKEAQEEYSLNHEQEFHFSTTLKGSKTDKSDKNEKSVFVHICPIKAHYSSLSGEITGMVVYMEDITQKHDLEMQVAQAQKMQAFGQLAGGVAHDFNNLLTAVLCQCELLLQRHGVGDPSFTDLLELKNNVIRAAEVARQLLAISRKQPLNPKLMDVTESFMEIYSLLTRVSGERIAIQINHGTDLGYIRIDPPQFSQVMVNLAINARDAMNGKGTLTISTRAERLNKPHQFGGETIKPGEFVVISVSDTGCGIPPENLNRIFEPFFTTKRNTIDSGTGLGLAMVYGIVRQTEGFIKVDSKVGKGTTFDIYFPSYESSSTENVAVAEQPHEEIIRDKAGNAAMTMLLPDSASVADNKLILGMNVATFDSQRKLLCNPGEIKILFVEDEEAVRMVGTRGLKQKGFNVVDCVSAENALEHIEKGEKFDMMITDMVMPGMSGADLAKVMKEKQPDTLIILASGYSEEIARKELAGSSDFYFIGKPYSLGNLSKKVMEVLAERKN